MNVALWIVQGLLVLLFLFAGGAKLVMSPEAMKGPVELPVLFMRFIGVCEVLGGLGLVLPQLTRIMPGLTPLAAAGLVVIMIGATVVSFMSAGLGAAFFPFVVLLLCIFVARGRSGSAAR
ncbi:MAG TPA: DoxX family protein [Candidatus Binatia bacterium]|jgi:uncharacterized membrane protein YphA (DoxX/SURF4 family)